MNLGYCCINLSLGKNIKTNRSKKGLKNLDKKQLLEVVSPLCLDNIKDLYTILKWNIQNNISLFRISSDIFPFWSNYNFEELLNFDSILHVAAETKKLILDNNLRVTFHPGPYSTISSNNQDVANKAIIDLNQHANFLDLLGLERSYSYPINIHIHNINPSKDICSANFIRNFEQLNDSCKSRLVIENDDSINVYTPKELKELITDKIGCPITFDFFHYSLGRNEGSELENLLLSIDTWKEYKPLTHYSSSKQKETNNTSFMKTAHSDYILEPINSYGLDIDCELEVKQKDLALLKYRKEFLS